MLLQHLKKIVRRRSFIVCRKSTQIQNEAIHRIHAGLRLWRPLQSLNHHVKRQTPNEPRKKGLPCRRQPFFLYSSSSGSSALWYTSWTSSSSSRASTKRSIFSSIFSSEFNRVFRNHGDRCVFRFDVVVSQGFFDSIESFRRRDDFVVFIGDFYVIGTGVESDFHDLVFISLVAVTTKMPVLWNIQLTQPVAPRLPPDLENS